MRFKSRSFIEQLERTPLLFNAHFNKQTDENEEKEIQANEDN